MFRPFASAVPALYLATVAAFADMYITQPLLPQLARDYGITPATAGLTISAVVLTTAVTSAAYGPLADVFGRRTILAWGTALLAASTFACGFASSFAWLVALRALQGVLLPAISALAVAYIHDELAGGDVPTVVGGYIAASLVGGLAGRIGGGVIADAHGWRATFGPFALLTLAGALALAWTLPRTALRTSRKGFARDLASSYGTMARHLGDWRLVGAFAMGGTLFFGFIGFFTYLPFYLTAAPFRLSNGAISWLYLPYLAGVIVSPIAGRLARHFSLRALMALGIAVAIVGIIASLAQVLAVIVIGAIVLCAGMFLAQPLAPIFVAVNAGASRGGATALYQSFYYLGAVFGSTLPGLAWEHWAWPGVVASCVASLALALVADWLLCRGPQRDLPRSRIASAAAHTGATS